MHKNAIFDLYQREKIITITDDKGKTATILLRKLNSYQEEEVIRCYREATEEKKLELQAASKANPENSFEETIKRASKNDVIDGIIGIEDISPMEQADLAPDPKTSLEEWRASRRKELNGWDKTLLVERLVDLTFSSLALAAMVDIPVQQSLVFMCLDPETKQPIFTMDKQQPNHIKNVAPKVYEELKKERLKFMEIDTPKDVREVTNNSNFPSIIQAG